MQKRVVISIYIIIGLFLIPLSILNKIQKQEVSLLDKKVRTYNAVILKQKEIIKKQKENLQKSEIPQHPIEEKFQKCIEKEKFSIAGKNKCIDISLADWEKGSRDALANLKKTIPDKNYQSLMVLQYKWNVYKEADWQFLDSLIKDKTDKSDILNLMKVSVVERKSRFFSGLNYHQNPHLYFERLD